MIHINSPLGLHDFPEFKPAPFFLSSTISSWFVNVITLGVLNASQLTYKERESAVLQRNQLALQLKYAHSSAPFNSILNKMAGIVQSLNQQTKTIDTIESEIESLETECEHIQYNPVAFDPTITPLAMEIFTTLGHILANFITLGFYGVIKARNLQNQVLLLEAENAHLTNKVEEAFNKAKISVKNQFSQLHDQAGIVDQHNKFKTTPEYILYQKLKSLEGEVKKLENEYNEIEDKIAALEFQAIDLQEKIGDEGTLVNILAQEQALKEVQEKIKATIAEMQKQLIGPLPSRFDDCESLLKAFEAYFQVNNKIDPDLKGDYGLVLGESDATQKTAYAKIAFACNTPDELVEQLFGQIFKAQLGQKGWLKNQAMKADEQRDQRLGIYNLMALDFIRCSILEKIDCHGYALKLNGGNLMDLAPSMPERVQRSKVKGEQPTETAIVFQRLNKPFTPPTNDPELPYGIDPVSAALIYRKKLTKQEKEMVDILLAESITPDDDAALLTAKAALKGPNGELIALAVTLISEVGLAIEKNFGLLLDAQWKTKAKDAGAFPFVKAPQQNEENTDQAFAGFVPMGMPNAVEAWANGSQILKGQIQDCQKSFQLVFDSMHPNALKNSAENPSPARIAKTVQNLGTANNPNKALLNYQYHITGKSIQSNGNLSREENFKTLSQFIVSNNPDYLTAHFTVFPMIREFLNSAAGKAFLDQRKEAMQHAGYASAQEFTTLFEYNDLKITPFDLEIFAHALGVRIGIFKPQAQTDINAVGLQVPHADEDYVGPNTKEIHYVYLENGVVYAMWPKMNPSALVGKAKDAAKTLEQHWNSISYIK